MLRIETVLLAAIFLLSVTTSRGEHETDSFSSEENDGSWSTQHLTARTHVYKEPKWFLMPDDNGKPHLALITDHQPKKKINLPSDVKFLLYTRPTGTRSLNSYTLLANDVKNLQASRYNTSHPTKILIHGFSGSANSIIIASGKDAYLEKGDYNVIGVDWGVLCKSPWYVAASNNARLVGQYVGYLVQFLVSQGAKLEDFHIVGHSLGAHVAGFAGSSISTGRVGRITGLDTALPRFDSVNENGRLDSSDAMVVDSIHTCSGKLGFRDPVGHVDFYPNGGICKQPGCGSDLFGTCSHSKAVEYFIHSIKTDEAFRGLECRNLKEAQSGTCSGSSTAVMGEPLNFGALGLYHVNIK
ncbi:pancreatic lipase-related protein 2-like [Periplaneta americana]|uniref:pancreatic lipase-related protein 2-like n=1 Tax=Periplaneta americana TaxID=6978 RepID=UPI0037E6FBC1